MSQHDLKHKYVRSNNTNNLSFPHFTSLHSLTHSLTSLTYSLSLIHIQSNSHTQTQLHTQTHSFLTKLLFNKKNYHIYINERMYE